MRISVSEPGRISVHAIDGRLLAAYDVSSSIIADLGKFAAQSNVFLIRARTQRGEYAAKVLFLIPIPL
jgi:hypothetical protein